MVVQHNLTAMNANRYLGINNSKLSKSLEKLSSGYAINRAGDNAAGLAVSEKMRSQIAGLTQGVKNAQDGISMVQTYEGALTETDSILQRMKTLADQSANGTYQDDVDRDAIQLEFDQLNDELNQIADTDFNGVVCLNGGQMADGTKAVNGKFDYENGTAKAPTKLGAGNVNLLDSNKWDDDTVADSAWAALNATWTRTTGQPATYGPNSVDITFKYDKSTSSWSAISATNGASIKNVTTSATDNGGFSVSIGTTAVDVANVVLDQDVLANGDTITLTFNNPSSGISAPTNQGALTVDTSNFTEGTGLAENKANNLTVGVGKMPIGELKAWQTAQETAAKSAKAADDAYTAYVTAATNNGQTAVAKPADYATNLVDTNAGANGYSNAVTDYNTAAGTANTDAQAVTTKKKAYDDALVNPANKVTDADMTEDVNELFNQLNGATFTASYSTNASTEADFKLTLKNGTELVGGATGAETEFVIGDTTFKMATDKATGVVTITDENATKTYYTIAAEVQAAEANAGENSTGSITWTLGAEVNEYDKGAKPTVEIAKTGKVSIADSNKSATAPLTYSDSVTLQAGARTKDSVKFTFEYTSNGLGDLKANMNCSARADGLGTENLSLRTQEDANYAIDRIDNAINKVSMVRATFGAVQNRLEHKIDNMNVTIENITSAESGIRDTNMPQEMMNFTKQQILAQASQSMLAQANQLPQSVLSLLQ